jgi:hypothetical protein
VVLAVQSIRSSLVCWLDLYWRNGNVLVTANS